MSLKLGVAMLLLVGLAGQVRAAQPQVLELRRYTLVDEGGEAKLDAYLDRISKGDTPKFTALAEDLERAGNRHDLMAAARSLDQWKKDSIP